MDQSFLQELARYQSWADAEHWNVLHANSKLIEDADIRKRLNHILTACYTLTTLARGEMPDTAQRKDRDSVEELEAAMRAANETLERTLGSADIERMIDLPRGPKGPFKAPAGVLLLQAMMHGQHHRGENAARIRELGVVPPMTDFVVWYALGRPAL